MRPTVPFTSGNTTNIPPRQESRRNTSASSISKQPAPKMRSDYGLPRFFVTEREMFAIRLGCARHGGALAAVTYKADNAAFQSIRKVNSEKFDLRHKLKAEKKRGGVVAGVKSGGS
ncbi:uncharacterized protein PAC_11801 [Phialocephala subalpina]|uniref:Uncharacterized protein n=1 Tax=Phialocephala subalpina TaxID=576137 RepID=A0A1L7XA57_9HELO|nr:uncharacterized protein PAC_11801 [Phialocephala subalpina]